MSKNDTQSIGIIPARYDSVRFPGKPLVDIRGKTMIQRVYERASEAKELDLVVVATDDVRIRDAVRTFGGQVVMTRRDHPSGTDRVAEAALPYPEATLIMNIQGDEPFIFAEQIDQLVRFIRERPTLEIATLAKRITERGLIENPNVVKVVINAESQALYFSRSPIPFQRDPAVAAVYRKHIGLYIYRATVLQQITRMEPHPLEQIEKLEQLRWLGNGLKIGVAETTLESIAIDHPEDLIRLEKFIDQL